MTIENLDQARASPNNCQGQNGVFDEPEYVEQSNEDNGHEIVTSVQHSARNDRACVIHNEWEEQ